MTTSPRQHAPAANVAVSPNAHIRATERPRRLAACGPFDRSSASWGALREADITQEVLAAALRVSRQRVRAILDRGFDLELDRERLEVLRAEPATHSFWAALMRRYGVTSHGRRTA